MIFQRLIRLLLLLTLPLLSLAGQIMPLKARVPPVTVLEAQTEIQRLISSNEAAGIVKLAPCGLLYLLFVSKKAIGTYKGGLFNGSNAAKSPINWWGKQIVNETNVNPLLSNAPNDTSVVFPYPRPSIAQARNIEHEGIVSTTIVYNKIPLMDYFRVVKDDSSTGELVLLGKSDLRGKTADPPYFWLKRTEGVKIDIDFKNPYPNTVGW